MLQNLPAELSERILPLNGQQVQDDRDFILYWMETAARTDDNPALNTAIHAAHKTGKALLVYHPVYCDDPYINMRKKRFGIEGMRDLKQDFDRLGIAYLPQLWRGRADAEKAENKLLERCALVLFELMPTRPWRDRRSKRAEGGDQAAWGIDASCLVPMTLTDKVYDRAYKFRDATKKLREERLDRDFTRPDYHGEKAQYLDLELPDFTNAQIASLIARTEPDPGLGPVPHTRGGMNAARARWTDFRDNRLKDYADARNDAAQPQQVSRMSPYLHFGHISAFQLAREARAAGGKGAEKFLDELLIWREMSWHYCYHVENHDQYESLPAWARETLEAHESDPRPVLYSWETLARAKTHSELWNAAQISLIRHGELHNNLRMGWGKEVLNWTPTARRALEIIIDLNHRFALDGNDPNSYTGLFWCLGGFDRPFEPEKAVFGTVRPRSLDQHARRMDVESYKEQVTTPPFSRVPKVAVIGAGIAGLNCARILQDHGLSVKIFEKSRGPGGRAGTRRTGDLALDHGADGFRATGEVFARFTRSWREDGVIADWQDGVTGQPRMSTLSRHLAADLDVSYENLVASIPDRDLADYDWTVLAIPAPQALAIVPQAGEIGLDRVTYRPQLTAMLVLAQPLPQPLPQPRPTNEAVTDFEDDAVLGRIIDQNTKPGRSGPRGKQGTKQGAKQGTEQRYAYVIQASEAFTSEHLETDQDSMALQLWGHLRHKLGLSSDVTPLYLAGQRWRYAHVDKPFGARLAVLPQIRLGLCGDWAAGEEDMKLCGIERAFNSGAAMAGQILNLEAAADS